MTRAARKAAPRLRRDFGEVELLQVSRKTMELIDTCSLDRPLAVQIYGAEPREMAAAAQWLENYGASVVDLNMGCPVHKVTRGGGGSAMMCDPGKTIALVRAVVEAVRIPITVKMRLGWDEQSWSAPHFAREFEQVGVAAVIIHGRTRAQGFSGQVSLDGIRAVVEAVERLPVIGNGDVRSIADAEHMLRYTGCAGVSIGRGALLNPWIFVQLQASENSPRWCFPRRRYFRRNHARCCFPSRRRRRRDTLNRRAWDRLPEFLFDRIRQVQNPPHVFRA